MSRIRAEGRFPGAEERPWIRLRLESWPEGDAGTAERQSALRDVLPQLGAAEFPAEAIKAVEMREELDLRTEPVRLVPHFVRTRRETRIEAEHAGERGSLSRVEETEHRYRY